MDRMFFTRADRSNENTTTGLHIPDVDVSNLPTALAEAANIETAFDAIVLADAHRVGITIMERQTAKSLSGLRESKWLIKYRDTVNFKEFSIELGTVDPAVNTVVETSGKEILDPSGSDYGSLKAALDGFALSPYGYPIDVYEVELVGRST